MKGLGLIALFVAASASGQTVQQVNDALATIKAQDDLLRVTSHNLSDMGVGQDKEVVISMGIMINRVRLGESVTVAVATLLPLMRDPEDARRVRAILQSTFVLSLREADSSIDAMNHYLTASAKPTVLAEATKARDEMTAIREQLRSLKTNAAAPKP
jgi:hypothetical protein